MREVSDHDFPDHDADTVLKTLSVELKSQVDSE